MPLTADESPSNREPAVGAAHVSPEAVVVASSASPARGMLTGALAPLRNANFCWLLSGQAISTLGDMFYSVALPWLILSQGGGAGELSLVLTVYGVARVGTSAVGGALSDRWSPRSIMLGADVIRALLVAGLAVLAFAGHPTVWQLCGLVLPLGVIEGLFLPAYLSITPRIVPDDDLQAANALGESANMLAVILGPMIAGVILARFSVGAGLAVDACTFIVSALALVAMRGGAMHAPTETAEREPLHQGAVHDKPDHVAPLEAGPAVAGAGDGVGAQVRAEVTTFWQFFRESRLMRVMLLLTVATNLTSDGVVGVALPTLASGQLAAGPSGYGLLLGASGIGMLAGGLSAGALGKAPRRGMIALGALAVDAAAVAAIPFAGGLIGAALALIAAGATTGVLSILFLTLLQQLPPRHLLGRVMGAFTLVSTGLYPLSVALAGAIIARWNAPAMFLTSGIVLLIAAVIGLSQREMREV